MKKVLFILHKKYYNNNYMIYMKILKLAGYEIHIITNTKETIKYCDIQKELTLDIFKVKNKINNYEMIFCNSRIIEIMIKIIKFKEKNKIIYINNTGSFQNNKIVNYNDKSYNNKEDYIFCSIGEFNKHNNQIMQLESMIRIIKKYPQVKLMLIGQGKLKDYYEHIIDKYGLSENVEIVENISFKIDIIKKSNCIISTRKREEFALDNIIAIILNKPILVSNVGINKLIFKQENIFYNSDELKEKMKSNIEENKDFEKYYDIELNEREEILKSESI